jgi:hypothetical protein
MTEGGFLCPVCSGLTEEINEGKTTGIRCTQCEWSVVTTSTSPIDQDTTLYEVHVKKSDHPNEKQIKLISSLGEINFLIARKKIIEGELIFRGKAHQVVSIKNKLNDVNLLFEINPCFKW